MPYIARERRPPIDAGINEAIPHIETVGDLNYAITRLCLGWLRRTGQPKPRYEHYNAVIGVLQCAALEFYGTRVRPYESSARVLNTDVH